MQSCSKMYEKQDNMEKDSECLQKEMSVFKDLLRPLKKILSVCVVGSLRVSHA